MKIGTSRVSIDQLDRLLTQKEYAKALAAIAAELRRRPGQLNLHLRQAEILNLQGERGRAIDVYREIAESQARDGFYARAIAVYKKIHRLDPEQEIEAELARLIEEDRQSKAGSSHSRGAGRLAGESSSDLVRAAEEEQELKELHASSLFSSFEREALEKIISSTELRSFKEGDIIVTEGERPDRSRFSRGPTRAATCLWPSSDRAISSARSPF